MLQPRPGTARRLGAGQFRVRIDFTVASSSHLLPFTFEGFTRGTAGEAGGKGDQEEYLA